MPGSHGSTHPRVAEQLSAPGSLGAAAADATDFPGGLAKSLWCSGPGLITVVFEAPDGSEVAQANVAVQAGAFPFHSIKRVDGTVAAGITVWPVYG